MRVKIEQRSVYHKFVELEIEIPDTVEKDEIDEYLLSIEDQWINDIDHKINEAEFVMGIGVHDHDGHHETGADSEWRYECEDLGMGGHL